MSKIDNRKFVCRACACSCPVSFELKGNSISKFSGVREDPLYRGFLCSRGQSAIENLYHPDRLLHSQKRLSDGIFVDIPVERAMDEIAEKLEKQVSQYGPSSIAFYTGTFGYGNPDNQLMGALASSLQTPMVFNSMSIDQPGKGVASLMHGRWLAGPQTFASHDVLLLVGSNPLVSYTTSMVPMQNSPRHLTDKIKDGMKLIVIDPRKTESARAAHIHLQPRPGEDAAILAAILNVIIRENLTDKDFVAENVSGYQHLFDTVNTYTPEFVSARADVPEQMIVQAARVFAQGPKGFAVGATGANMSGHSSLIEYLLLCLNSVCGRWLRAGERVANPGVLLPPATAKAQAEPASDFSQGPRMQTRNLGMMPCGMPTAAAADEILLEDDSRIRTLFVTGGNPVAAWPDQKKTVKALKRLDLLVAIDVKMSGTAKLADYIIAPKIKYERPHTSYALEAGEFFTAGYGYCAPYGSYASSLMTPPMDADVIEEWEFYYGIGQRLGKQLVIHPAPPAPDAIARDQSNARSIELDMETKPTWEDLMREITRGSRIPWDVVKQNPMGTLYEAAEHEGIVAPKDPGHKGKLSVGNADMMRELSSIRDEPAVQDQYEGFEYLLISRRSRYSYNSTCLDLPDLVRKAGKSYNPAFMHPDDLDELEMKPEDLVEISSRHGTMKAIVDSDTSLKRGVVSMTHCYDDLSSDNNDRDTRKFGSNTNTLTETEEDFDSISGIPRMSALPVSVSRLPS